MRRIARQNTELGGDYDVVIVGSGYGASVAAARLAGRGHSVCVLERGREWLPGEFPRGPGAVGEFHIDFGDEAIGDRDSLYDVHVDGEMSVLAGCGLGGTSLINANVVIEADERVFADGWPTALAGDGARIADCMKEARRMLGAAPLPARYTPAKLTALEAVAETIGGKFLRPDLTVTYTDGPNAVGVEQHACTGCGNCVAGCNDGAKNNLRMNYLPAAAARGAEFFTQLDVRRVAPADGGGWIVVFDDLTVGNEDARRRFVHAGVVVLGAGAVGSTEILLRSRDALAVSPMLGQRFSGNGDLMGFAYATDHEINGIGVHDGADDFPVGPTITGAVRVDDPGTVTDSCIIEDSAVPSVLAPYFPAALTGSHPGWDNGPGAILSGAHDGPIDRTLMYLVMGHDDSGGVLSLDDDEHLRIAWPGAGRQHAAQVATRHLEAGSEALGGEFFPNPAWEALRGRPLVTVHPLGGCPMGDDASTGVVDHRGLVFRGESGTDVHEGLYVMDAAVIPRALGVNPLLTITALAERACRILIEENEWDLVVEPDDDGGAPVAEPVSPPPLLRFDETMRGWISRVGPDATPTPTRADYEAAARRGEENGTSFDFAVTIELPDIAKVIEHPELPGRMRGTAVLPSFDDDWMAVRDGEFRLFDPDGTPGEERMRYRLPLHATDGRKWLVVGYKTIGRGWIGDVWSDTTTLYVDIHEGLDGSGPVVARGVVEISLGKFLQLLRSMEVDHARNEAERLALTSRFGAMFAGNLTNRYGGVLASVDPLDRDAPPRPRRELACGKPEEHPVTTGDGVEIRLLRWKGGDRGPVVLVHGAGASSGLFSTDTIDTNLVEYLWAEGFDVWALDWRASIHVGASTTMFTGDDAARYDYPAASDYVRAVTGVDQVHWLVHCVGSITFFMSLLGNWLDADHVASVIALQIATHTVAPWLTRLKCGLHVPEILDAIGIDSITAETWDDDSLGSKVFNQALRLTPISPEERCTSAVCLRCTFLYGLCWKHDNLTDATHDSIHEMMGVTNMRIMAQMAACASAGKLVDAEGRDVYLPNFSVLQMPITLLQGSDNEVWKAKAVEKTISELKKLHDDGRYELHFIPGYGHLDTTFGRNAVTDAYPAMLAHFERIGV